MQLRLDVAAQLAVLAPVEAPAAARAAQALGDTAELAEQVVAPAAKGEPVADGDHEGIALAGPAHLQHAAAPVARRRPQHPGLRWPDLLEGEDRCPVGVAECLAIERQLEERGLRRRDPRVPDRRVEGHHADLLGVCGRR